MAAGILAASGGACDPGTPQPDAGAGCPSAPVCQRNTLLQCGPDGGLLEMPCGDQRCATDAPIPRCVPAGALPCDPEAPDVPDCENGLIVTCDPASAYRLPTDCGAGHVCDVNSGRGECVPLDFRACTVQDWSPLCVAGRRIECDPASHRLFEAGGC